MKRVQNMFGRNIHVRSKFSCVRSSYGLCARAHSLEGTLPAARFLRTKSETKVFTWDFSSFCRIISSDIS